MYWFNEFYGALVGKMSTSWMFLADLALFETLVVEIKIEIDVVLESAIC